MTAEELAHYRQRLTALADRLSHDLLHLQDETLRSTGGEASGSLSNVPLHLADLGTDSFEEEISLGLVGNEERMLAEINDALGRIDQGTFGRCEECDREINPERLQAMPYSRYCVACAQKTEKKSPR